MRIPHARCPATCILVITLSIASPVLARQESEPQSALADAHRLYVAADYTGALEQFERLAATDRESRDRHSIALFRMLCLFALERTPEADAVMTSLIQDDPFFTPADADMPPRFRAAYNDKRRLLLPAAIQSRFLQAKHDFDDGHHASAIDGFDQVLKLLSIPEIADDAGRPPLSDLAVLANGFKNLAHSAMAAAPPAAAPPPPQPEPAPAAKPATRPQLPTIYDTSNVDVVAPVTLKQDLPRALSLASAGKIGVLFIVVDEAGHVESAIITVPVDQSYDRLLLAAARKWTYRPATLNGVAVKYRKRIQVVLPQEN